MPEPSKDRSGTLCPICGSGRLTDISFDDGEGDQQQPESREVLTFTCGHEVSGPQLQSADADKLDVERRDSEGTVDPGPAEND